MSDVSLPSYAHLWTKLRRHYTPILNTEPNFKFRVDGNVQVYTSDGREIELTKQEVKDFEKGTNI